MSDGNSGMTLLILSRTSWAATSRSLSKSNWTMTIDTPSEETERNSSMPLIVLTAPSILSVISVSMSSGAEPGRTVVTVTNGNSIFGKRSNPSFMKLLTPNTTSTRISTVAKTGRLTQIAAKCFIVLPCLRL